MLLPTHVSLPFDRISLEMIYRGLYHFYVAHQKGLATIKGRKRFITVDTRED
jgi:hypothetical protein